MHYIHIKTLIFYSLRISILDKLSIILLYVCIKFKFCFYFILSLIAMQFWYPSLIAAPASSPDLSSSPFLVSCLTKLVYRCQVLQLEDQVLLMLRIRKLSQCCLGHVFGRYFFSLCFFF